MSTCTFFGHRDCPDSILPNLRTAISALIVQYGVTRFYVGTHGNFDALCRRTLRELQQTYPHIRYDVVLAYLPSDSSSADPLRGEPTLYPAGIETAPKRYAITWRNRWMLQRADFVITYVTHPSGGAARFAEAARRQGKTVVPLAKDR